MSTACWMIKATNTHSEYAIIMAFPRQQWLQERTSLFDTLVCVHLPISLSVYITVTINPTANTNIGSTHVQAKETPLQTMLHKQSLSEIKWNANLMQIGNAIDVFLARHVSGTYGHHQEHSMFSCTIWFSIPSFWMGGGLESVYGAYGAVRARHHPHRTHDLPSGSQDHHPSKNSVQKPYAATQHLMLLMMAVCTWNMSS